MKLYKFFKVPDKKLMNIPDSEFSLKQKYPLYALTTDKKMARAFQSQRDMKKFLYMEDSMDESEGESYVNAFRGRLLDWITFRTQAFDQKKPLHERTSYNLQAVLCDSEFDLISEYCDSAQILSLAGRRMLPPDIFTDRMLDSLHAIGYDTAFSICSGGDQLSGDLPFEFDYFRVFLCIYGDTLAKNFFKSVKFIK